MLEIFNGFLSSAAMFVSVFGFAKIVFDSFKKRKAIYNIILVITIILLYTIVFLRFNGTIKSILLCFLFMSTYNIFCNISIGKAIISSIIYYILLIIPDVVSLVTAVYIFKIDKEVFYNTMAGGIIGNLSVSIVMILITYILKKPLKKVTNINISSNKKIIFTSIITFVFIAIFFYKFAIGYRLNQDVIVYIIAMLAFSTVLFSLLKQKLDNDKIAKKYDNLLDIMKNYESDIEEQRTLIHETRNELTTIRSKIKDKEKENEIIEYIDSIMGDKVSSNMSKFSKFKYLPSNGLKGFFYYKVTEAERKEINVSVNISRKIENSFLGRLDTRNFKDLARIIGVYVDNAIEASSSSSDKKLGIEIYMIKNNIEIIISNTYANSIDKGKIGKEKYSTKGKNRGYGLLLVKRILNDNKIITSINEITNKLYIQKIIIKNNENKKDQ